jgi:hypothetical protein
MKKAEGMLNQSIYDFALQHTGSVEGVFEVIAVNPELDLNSMLSAGIFYNVPEVKVDKDIASHIVSENILIAKGDNSFSDFNEDFNEDFG